MQKVGPRSKLRFPALYLQQLTIPHVKHGLEIVVVRFSCAMTIGFARVSTVDQNPEYQIRAL